MFKNIWVIHLLQGIDHGLQHLSQQEEPHPHLPTIFLKVHILRLELKSYVLFCLQFQEVRVDDGEVLHVDVNPVVEPLEVWSTPKLAAEEAVDQWVCELTLMTTRNS